MALTSWFFLRLLGLVYLIAFSSFGIQATGLVGQNGILPAHTFLAAVRRSLGKEAYLYYPTLFWIDASDRSIKLLCFAGSALSVLLVFGLQITPVLVLLWVGYLSLVNIGQVFLSYQWDALLLEAGFLAIFLAPPSLLPNQAFAPPSPLMIFLFRWLLFRLIFMSGILKLASGDPTWRNLTAMSFHFETQPLPNPLAPRMHALPLSVQKLSTLFTLVAEIGAPFLYFGPQLFRGVGAILTFLLQGMILLTGNFAFFNWLTIVLALPLLDDTVLSELLPGSLLRLAPTPAASAPHWGDLVLIPLTFIILATGALILWMRLSRQRRLPKPLRTWLQIVSAFRLVNGYGLFTVMTTERPEILVQGSQDGENWLAYEFKYKAGDPARRPPFVAPHQPRLDWQMWFAALGDYTDNPWFLHFVERLLENKTEVTRLLAHNPFADRPPKYIRAILYDYHYSTPAERAAGQWWRREELGLYLPAVSYPDEE